MIIMRKANEKKSSIVDLIWYVHEMNIPDERRSDIIPPSGHVHVVYNLEDPYFFVDKGELLKVPDIVLAGQFKNALNVQYGKNLKQIGIAIKPLALYSLFQEVSGVYTEARVDCSGIPSMQNMHKRIKWLAEEWSSDPEAMIDKIQEYFQGYSYDDSNTGIYEDMLNYIDNKKGGINVKVMAQEFGYSISSLERNFKKHVGLTPKAYGDIIRFRFAMKEEDPKSMFYDQSHFIKNCRKYTKKIPEGLSKSQEISLLNILSIETERE